MVRLVKGKDNVIYANILAVQQTITGFTCSMVLNGDTITIPLTQDTYELTISAAKVDALDDGLVFGTLTVLDPDGKTRTVESVAFQKVDSEAEACGYNSFMVYVLSKFSGSDEHGGGGGGGGVTPEQLAKAVEEAKAYTDEAVEAPVDEVRFTTSSPNVNYILDIDDAGKMDISKETIS